MRPGADAPAAVVLLSGGLDSSTVLAVAQDQGYRCFTLAFAYGQRHAGELQAARTIAERAGVERHLELPMDLTAFGGSALTDPDLAVPEAPQEGIPITYVPARNTVFLSLALAWAEVLEATDLFIGRQRGGLLRLPGLPAGVHQSVRTNGQSCHPRRR